MVFGHEIKRQRDRYIFLLHCVFLQGKKVNFDDKGIRSVETVLVQQFQPGKIKIEW